MLVPLRAALLVLLVASSAFLYDTAEAWTPGQHVLGPPFLLTFLAVPCAVLGFVSGVLRVRVPRAATVTPYVTALLQGGLVIVYTALIALLGGDWLDHAGRGWLYIAETYVLAAAMLSAFWWVEDRFVRRRRKAVAGTL